MLGEEEAVDDERSFSSKSPLRRISIILAGAFMNFVLAIVILSTISNIFGFATTSLDRIEAGTPAASAGLMPGDRITRVNGSKVFTNSDISVGVNMNKGKKIDLEYERGGLKDTVTIEPAYIEDEGRYMIGVYFKGEENPSILSSIKESFNETASLISQTFKGLKMIFTGEANLKTDVGGPVTIIKMSAGAAEVGVWNLMKLVAILSVSIAVFNLLPFPALDGGFNETASLISQTFKGLKMIFTGEANLKTDVGGPVTIIKMSAGAAEVGVWNLMKLVAILSVSIAVFNLLPFPALDGGWAVILFIELITRRKVPDKIVGVLNTVGFMLLIGIMILVTIKDIIFPISFFSLLVFRRV